MSAESVQEIIIKAITDKEYRELLFSDLEKALEGVELTAEETTALKEMERENFDAVASELEDRVSRAGMGITGTSSKIGGGRFELRNKGIAVVDD